MSFEKVFFWGPLGVDYEFGVLEHHTRSAIQMLHRLGALIVTFASVVLIFALKTTQPLKEI
jgi:cytochrome c oxidase assembly protein subunit 15